MGPITLSTFLSLRTLAITLFLLPTLTTSSCECGYILNSPTSPTLYTHLLETDFLHLSSFASAASPLNGSDWLSQNYTVSASLARGPYGKNASVDNVRLNPLKNKSDWSGEGVNGGEAGLEVFVRKLGEGAKEGGLIGMGELASSRVDMLFGTFRVGMKMSAVNGTCGAFFWYFNDTQEIDLEFLSQQNNLTAHPLNLVLQSPQSASSGFNAANTRTFQVHHLPFDPTTAFHEYRFDWSLTSVSFYADGVLLDTMTDAVPNSPGHITLSHWSNGDPGWSGGPPEVDAMMLVEYVKAYFNSSDPDQQTKWKKGCKDINAVNATCAIPDLMEPPDGNVSAKTFFFNNEDGGKAAGKKNEVTRARASPFDGSLMVVILLPLAICIFL